MTNHFLRPDDIVAYAYKAGLVCPCCIVALIVEGKPNGALARTEDALDQIARARALDRMDETSFDSDQFPKVVFRDQLAGGGDLPDGWTATDTAKRAACRIDTSGLPATCEVCGEVLDD